MWNFENIPEQIRNRFVDEYRSGHLVYVRLVLKEHNVFSGKCGTCMNDQLRTWVTWAIEDGPLKGYGTR